MGRRIQYRPGRQPTYLPGMEPVVEKRTNPNVIIILAVVGVLVLLGAGVCGFIVIQDRRFQSEFSPLVDVCRGKRVDAASIYTPAPGKHLAVAVKTGSKGWELDAQLVPLDIYLIPSEAKAQPLAETQTVLCLGPMQEVHIERCPYGEWEGPHQVSAVVDRYYYQQEAKLIEAKTGRVITTQRFTGNSPEACPKTQLFGNEKTVKLMGSEVALQDVHNWTRTHLIIK